MNQTVENLEKRLKTLNAMRFDSVGKSLKAVAQPEFKWDVGLKQANDMVKLLQKNKLEVSNLNDLYTKFTKTSKELALQQARLSRASQFTGANGMQQMFIPSKASAMGLASALELSNRQLKIQGEMMTALGTQVQNWGKNMQWAGRQVMVGITIPFAAAAAAAGVYAFTVDKELTRIEKVYDGSTKGLREMSMETAKMISNTMGQGVKESLEVMGEFAAVGKTGIDLQRATAESQRLATLGEMDRMQSLKSIISLQSTFKMSTQETAEAINYMNAVENATSLSMSDFAEAIPRAAAPVAELGGSIKELGTVLVAMKERGVDAAEGANAIKTLMNRLLNPAKETEQLFNQLTGKSLKNFVRDTNGQLMPTLLGLSKIIQEANLSVAEQQQLIGQLAGSYQMTRMTAILQGLADTSGQVGRAMKVAEQSTGELTNTAMAELDTQVNSLSGQFKRALESFKAEMQEFGEIALKAGTIILSIGSKVLEFINSLPDWVKTGLAVGGAVAAIAGPLVMIVGVIGNLIGTMGKAVGFMMRLGSNYKTMTVEQKANELASDSYNKTLLTQADYMQVVVMQMNKMVSAYTALGQAQKQAALTSNPAMWNVSGMIQNVGPFTNPILNQRFAQTSLESRGALNPLNNPGWDAQVQSMIDKNATGMRTVANNTEEAAKFQMQFRGETLLAVSAVSGLVGMAADGNSKWAEWLSYISLASAGLYAMLPILAKVGTAIKNTAMFQNIANATSGAGGMMSNLGSKAGGLAASLGRFLVNPATLVAGATAAVGYGLYRLITAEERAQVQRLEAITNSTDGWAKALGFVKAEMGQIRNESGQVKDSIDSIAEKLKAENSPLVEELRSLTDSKMYDRIRMEIYKLQGQGIGQDQINMGIQGLLRAAGKTKAEIEQIMNNIKVDFDFRNAQNDLGKFVQDMTTRMKTNKSVSETAKSIWERMISLDPAQRAYILSKFNGQMEEVQKSSRENMIKMFRGTAGFDENLNWEQMLDKFTTFKDGTFLPKGTFQASQGIASEANYLRSLAVEMGKLAGVSPEVTKNFKTFADVLPYLNQGTMTSTEAIAAYEKAVAGAEKGGQKLTEQQKRQIAIIYATAAGLDAAKLAAGQYSKNQVGPNAEENARKLGLFIDALNRSTNAGKNFFNQMAQGSQGFSGLGDDVAAQAQSLTNSVKDIYSGTMNTIYDVFGAQAERQMQARMDRITQGFERRRDALEKQSKALDKRWDATMKDTAKQYDRRKKQIEVEAEAEEKAIENQIKAIENKRTAEQEVEEQRQRMFEAEERRIERLTELQNRNIDFNRALAEGKLDEAARIQNNVGALQTSWSTEDANMRSQEENERKDKAVQKEIEVLNERKKIIQESKAARLQALQEEEQAVTESLQRQAELEKERLQMKMEGLQKEQRAAEDTERRRQEVQRRSLEIQLATLKAFIPQNEEQLWQHIGRVQGAYSEHGVRLTIKGGEWGQIIGDALKNNVDRARNQMSNDQAWSSFGSSVAGAISQGAFGLSLGDFFNMITTGKPPANWKPPGAQHKINFAGGLHTGGMVGVDSGGRLGRTGDLYPDEVPAILQKGEYVLNKNAVNKYGTDFISNMNAGNLPTPYGIGGGDPGVSIAGLFGGMIARMMAETVKAVFVGPPNSASGLASFTMGQKAGRYGNVTLSEEQVRNANIIANVGKSMGASTRDIVISLMTAMQESTLKNLNYGDRDSLGLFQQRPSQGWGTPAQVTNPEYASRKFFEGLLRVKGRDSMPLTLAAQAVQRSAFPYAYAKWQSMAEALVGAGVGSISNGMLPGFGLLGRLVGGAGYSPVSSGAYQKPVNGRVTSEYGNRINPITRRAELHDGIDIGAPSGTPIYATSSGTVVSAGFNNGGFGNWTIIDHGGLMSGYAHQSKIAVSPGQRVQKGQYIGNVGSTGRSTGPHLHFQMGGGPRNWRNPRDFIPALMNGGTIRFDNTLANLHKRETVLTAPLSQSLENGIRNLENNSGDINVTVNINGVTNLSEQDIINAVHKGIDQKNRMEKKRKGEIR